MGNWFPVKVVRCTPTVDSTPTVDIVWMESEKKAKKKEWISEDYDKSLLIKWESRTNLGEPDTYTPPPHTHTPIHSSLAADR